MTETELAYMAGMFDAKACILINKRTQAKNSRSWYHFLQITLNYADANVVDIFQEAFGGGLCWVQGSRRWTITTQQAENVLRQLLPYLKAKRPQADAALRFCGLMESTNSLGKLLSDDVAQERERIRVEIHELNERVRPSISKSNWEKSRS